MRIDSHQHFWLYEPTKDAWITPEMQAIAKNFLPNDISGELKKHRIDGVVAVQADQSQRETDFLLELSSVYALIKGVVGWIDLRSAHIDELLARYTDQTVLKGFRHIVEAEVSPDFMIDDAFFRGLEAIQRGGYSFDLLVSPSHYQATLRCVRAYPEMRFVLDHMAKPRIGQGRDRVWEQFIEDLAAYPHVYCKVSGLITEADWSGWTAKEFIPYFQHVVHCFGWERLMYGSDWPVCVLASDYQGVINLAAYLLDQVSPNDQAAFWGETATAFYRLK